MAESTGGAGRAVFRLFALVVVAAAGVGGWFAYDWLLAESESGSPAAAAGTDDEPVDVADNGLLGDDPLTAETEAADLTGGTTTADVGAASPPWPADVVPATRPWTSFVTSFQPKDDVIRQQMAFDAVTKQTQMKLFDPDGVEVGIVETRGTEVWFDEGDGWQGPDQPNGGFLAGASHVDVLPPTIEGLLPAAVWPFVSLESDAPDPEQAGVRRLVFVVGHLDFAAADPMAASEWRADIPAVVDDPTERWTIDVDGAGHVVRFNFDTDDVTVHYSELVQPILFSSPLAG